MVGMTTSQESDAIALWQDALTLLAERNVAPATLAMLRSCQAVSFDGEKLTVSTNMGFAQRKISQQAPMIEECLEQAAFQPVGFEVILTHDSVRRPVQTGAEMSREEVGHINTTAAAMEPAPAPANVAPKGVTAAVVAGTSRPEAAKQPVSDFKNEVIDPSDSKLTFDRFVSGEENEFAFDAAKQVANGGNKSYNPLFIYGKSGLGKTHLLRAIQNYIAQNDPSRLCVYRTGTEFVDDYVNAMNVGDTPAKAALSRNYQNVDVLIIDDIQNMRRAAGTISFFFETYNTLMSHGKQIVLAADRSPSQLGMGDSKFDERETSRMDSGVTVSIQVPDYELKLKLINSFYDTMKQDAVREHIPGMTGTISEADRKLMAEKSGTNIRIIEGFVHTCLITASRKEKLGERLDREDIIKIANAKWPTGQKTITVEQIQKAVETYYDVSHMDLVGSKRNKELMEPRHVAVWLTRELTDNTLADIGKKFGGRSHATVKHSIFWVDKTRKEDRIFQDRIQTLQDGITDNR